MASIAAVIFLEMRLGGVEAMSGVCWSSAAKARVM